MKKWLEICIHTTNEAQEAITNIIEEAGVNGVVIEDPLDLTKERDSFFGEIYELDLGNFPKAGIYIKFYLPREANAEEQIEHIKGKIDGLSSLDIDLGKNQLTSKEIHEDDWANEWKKYYKPVKISEKITIAPTWEKVENMPEGGLLIELDPGMAFGTGTHPTTMQSVRGLEQYVKPNDTMIDVGCGSGVLSIAGCLLGAQKSHAFDIDPVAINSTKINAEINGLSNSVEARENNLLKDIDIQADVIVANILAEIILLCVDDAYRLLKKDGMFITAGIIQKKKEEVIDKMTAAGFSIVEVNELKDWVSIIAKK